ncbi:MAG: hypothetical protein HY905_03420 [Deltaproteobacteria bacterium]|nr:hypothetical protein [Deltaproteobacteria bacterium]
MRSITRTKSARTTPARSRAAGERSAEAKVPAQCCAKVSRATAGCHD